uniref:Uncharacterized protein n=1 Tax=Setaria digitata TaxID=48799 RepID=A0A915Q238_9BILA
MLQTQQLTPIIGGKCDLNSPDVPIGGKQTQFFLKCEQSLQSENGKGIWVVKSRTQSTTLQTTSSTTLSTTLPSTLMSQNFHKPDSNICVQDKSAQVNDACLVSSLCLQQDQTQLSNYLQCDQSTNHWVKKSCLDGRIFSFEHQACIVPNISPFKQSRLGTRKFVEYFQI